MALLKCCHCGTEIDSNARKTRCPGCGQLFPFKCAVCETPLRPPFHVFSDERYLDEDNQPLCPDHFQRQCPRCQTWFSANENPGYFLCRTCMEEQEEQQANEPAEEPEPAMEEEAVAAAPQIQVRPRRERRLDVFDAVLTAIVFLSMVAVVVILGWQVFATIRPILGF